MAWRIQVSTGRQGRPAVLRDEDGEPVTLEAAATEEEAVDAATECGWNGTDTLRVVGTDGEGKVLLRREVTIPDDTDRSTPGQSRTVEEGISALLDAHVRALHALTEGYNATIERLMTVVESAVGANIDPPDPRMEMVERLAGQALTGKQQQPPSPSLPPNGKE